MRQALYVAFLGIVCGGCSFSASCGGGGYDAEEVEGWLKKDGTFGNVTKAECPEKVDVEVGKTFECTIEIAGGDKPHAIVVTVNSVEGKKFNVSGRFKEPTVVGSQVEQLEKEIGERFGNEVAIDCPEGPIVLEDRKTTCPITIGGAPATMTVELGEDQIIRPSSFEPEPLSLEKIAEGLSASVQSQTNPNVKIDCGPNKVIIRPADGVVRCQISDGQQTATIRIEVDAQNTVLGWKVEEPTP